MMRMNNQINKAHLFLTDRCNLRCPTCFVDASGRFENELSTQEWLKVIEELNEIGVKETHVEGGEPFLRKDLVEILSGYNHRSGALLATNATIDYRDDFKRLNDIMRLSISIESYNPKHHQVIKASNLDKVVRNLERFRDAGFYVNTNSVLTTITYRDLPEIAKRGVELGIPMARFAMFEIIGRGLSHQELKLSDEQYKEAIELYLQTAEKYEDKITLTLGLPAYAYGWLPQTLPDNVRISVGKEPNQFAITAEGTVYPCASHINSPKHRWGNVRDENIAEIVENKLKEYHPCSKGKCNINACCTIGLTTK